MHTDLTTEAQRRGRNSISRFTHRKQRRTRLFIHARLENLPFNISQSKPSTGQFWSLWLWGPFACLPEGRLGRKLE